MTKHKKPKFKIRYAPPPSLTSSQKDKNEKKTKKKGLIRKLDTLENRAFWAGVDKAAKKIESWPQWKKELFPKNE